VFDWDENNLRKIRAHRIKREEVERVLSSDPILIYEQDGRGEVRYVYYCETAAEQVVGCGSGRAPRQNPGGYCV
jgi:hypothetical protein